jgi:DNA adenine methylase
VGAKSGPTDLPVGADDLVPTEPPVGSKAELAEHSFVRRKLGGVVHDYFDGPEEIDHAYAEIEVVERHTSPGDGAEDRRGEWDSVPSLIARMGAKSILADWLVERVPRHHTWVEPFMGSCKVLFAKKQRSRIEIINDFDGDLVSFFRYVQYRPDELAKFVNSIPTHEAIVLGLREALGDRRLRGIQRAAAFYLGSQSAFNSKGDYSSYASSPQVKLDLSIDVAAVRKVADRLRGVDIRSTGYRRVIESANKRMGPAYHGPVFFYCDPPYWQTAGYATLQGESSFSWGDQVALADLMKEVTDAGNLFVITNSGHPDLYRIYKERGFFIEEREVYYSVSGDAEARKKSKEYIVSNFKLEGAKRQGGLFG